MDLLNLNAQNSEEVDGHLDTFCQDAFDDPDDFFEDVLGTKLWSKEREILHSVKKNRKTTVRSCHSAGKTYTTARIALWFMFAFGPQAVVIDTAPTERQVKNQFWREFRSAHQRSNYPLGGKLLTTQYTIDEDWFAIGFAVAQGEEGSEKFQGWHGKKVLIIVDEASGVHGSVYEAITGIMAGGDVRLVLIGNPTRNTGDFAESWKDPSFNLIHISAYDIPNVIQNAPVVPGLATHEWVEEMKEKYGEDSDIFRVRVLGQPPRKDSDTLISLERVENALGSDRERYGKKQHLLLDPARFGVDRSAFLFSVGNYAKVRDIWQGKDTMFLAGECMKALREYPHAVLKIDITGGLGAGVFDRLREQEFGNRVEGVNVSASPLDKERFPLLRDEGWDMMNDWLKDAVLEPSPEWVELALPKYKILSNGKTKLESKEDMKKRKVKSPDVGDALALKFQRATEGGDMGVVFLD